MASPVAVQRRFSESGSASRGSSTSGGEDGELPGMRSAVVEVHPNASPNLMGQSPSPTPSPPPHHPTERDRGERRRRTPPTPPSQSDKEVEASPPPKRKKMEPDPLTTRTGGAYIPPARLRMMQEGITDKSSVAYQRIAWEALKKSINGLVNKVNVSNIANILSELFQENVVRGRGVLAQSIIRAQTASPMFTNVYAALVAIVNTKFPQTGELVATRLIVRFKKSFRRNDKAVCIATVKFLAHLVNQQVLHELVGLELLMLLLEEPSDDSVEVAVGFIKECGMKLQELTPKGLHSVFETLRTILHSGKIASRVQYMIEVLFAIRKDRFQAHPAVLKELDLVNEDDQITHLLSLADEDYDPEDMLNVFRPDSEYLENEEKYKMIREEILGEGVGSGSSDEEDSDEEEEEESEEDSDEEGEKKMAIEDMTGANEKSVRRQIYLTIMSSLDFEECAHKLLKTMGEGHEKEIALMLVECCGQERSYLRFYGLLGQRLCLLNQAWVAVFDQAFQDQYETVHRLETNKLRNVAKFFGQLFYVDALPWTSMACIRLNEEETNSSSRIFIKILFQELAEFMGLPKLNEKLRDPMLSVSFEGLMPRENPQNTRFAINFFTSIGLGGLTDDLREHLKNAQKLLMAQKQAARAAAESSSSSSSSSESSSEESSSSESSDAGRKRKRGREKEREREKRRRRDEKEDRERRSKRDHRERRDEERRREKRRHQRREEEEEKESRRSSSKKKEHRHRDRDSRK